MTSEEFNEALKKYFAWWDNYSEQLIKKINKKQKEEHEIEKLKIENKILKDIIKKGDKIRWIAD